MHLSDSDGMPILSQLLWAAANQQLERREPEPEVRARSAPLVPRRLPRVVVTGKVATPRHSNIFEWTDVGPRRQVMWSLSQFYA